MNLANIESSRGSYYWTNIVRLADLDARLFTLQCAIASKTLRTDVRVLQVMQIPGDPEQVQIYAEVTDPDLIAEIKQHDRAARAEVA